MPTKKKKPKILRGMPGSTEAAARQVLKKHLTPKKKSVPKDTGGKTTATSPRGVKKTPTQGAEERAALRKKQAERVKRAKEAAKKKRKK